MTDKEKLEFIHDKVVAFSLATAFIAKIHKDDLDAKGLLNMIFALCTEILEVYDNG